MPKDSDAISAKDRMGKVNPRDFFHCRSSSSTDGVAGSSFNSVRAWTGARANFVTTGMGGPTFNFRGDLEIKARPAGDELRKTVFEDSSLTQYWLDDKELRLNIYREHQVANTYSSVELTILTKAIDEGVYDGHYKLAVYDSTADKDGDGKPANLSGPVSCGSE